MMQGGNVTLVGFVATEPKMRYSGKGVPVVHMRVGASSRWVDRETGDWKDGGDPLLLGQLLAGPGQ